MLGLVLFLTRIVKVPRRGVLKTTLEAGRGFVLWRGCVCPGAVPGPSRKCSLLVQPVALPPAPAPWPTQPGLMVLTGLWVISLKQAVLIREQCPPPHPPSYR